MKNTNAPNRRKPYTMVTPEKRAEIIEYWRTHQDNTTPLLAEKFGYSIDAVNKVLETYLQAKRPL